VSCENFEYPKLRGKRILVVEDEPVISVDYRFLLLAMGAWPQAYMPTNASAVSFLETHEVDAVIVDYRLRDGTSEPLMGWLRDHHVPFVVITGWVEKLRSRGSAVRALEKPTSPNDLWQALSEVMH
jgi:CheY-like chemotaxis protein